MLSPHEVLKKYWGFDDFRESQLEVIDSVLEGKDTLVLLPTGGGKSICYQVPAMMLEGICIVISPLIALMNDQVSHLKGKNIKAVAITSGLTMSEQDVALDNCIYGNYKFLYLSPERLENEMVKKRLEKMTINLVAVDESHCISQWGYHFRPSYLKIANIRSITNAPIVALTATATKLVTEDIQEKLEFKNKHIIKSSFYREELSYVVLYQEDKDQKIIQVLNRVKGSSVIYCKTRKETKRLHVFLRECGISSHYYHGGLDYEERLTKQKQWLQNHVRVMVATNAFGMGIDKSDVRLVIHNHLPFNLESYYQEAGRAARDRKLGYAILICNTLDIQHLQEDIEMHYPNIEDVRHVYQQLANHLGIAEGSGQGTEYSFQLIPFCEKYNLEFLKTFNVLKLLEKEELIKLNEAVNLPSRIYIKLSHSELYTFQIANKAYDNLLKILLRSYGTLFETFTKIQESILAKRAQLSTEEIKEKLTKLDAMDVLHYIPQNSQPKLIYLKPRLNVKRLHLSSQSLQVRKANEIEKSNTVIDYVKNQHQCRSSFLIRYFGEKNNIKCGKCDVCLQRNKLNVSNEEFDKIVNQIEQLLKKEAMSVEEIIMTLIDFREDKIVEVLQFLSDNDQIIFNEKKKLLWYL